jgi:hypothetical protein
MNVAEKAGRKNRALCPLKYCPELGRGSRAKIPSLLEMEHKPVWGGHVACIAREPARFEITASI